MVSKHSKPGGFWKPIRFFNLIFILFFLIGCDRAGPRPEASSPVNDVPTTVALTAATLPSPTLAEAVSTATAPPTFTLTPTRTSTATPFSINSGKIPLPAIRVLSPGPMSKLVSPIILKSYIRPGYEGQIQVELLGEDGRLLARDLFRRETLLVEGAYVRLEIPFETRAAAEVGRLQISTKDEFGRPLALYSVHLLLLSVGENDFNRSDTEYPRAIFFYPKVGEEIYGGVLPIIAEIQAYNDNPIILELLDEEGKTLGLRTLHLAAGIREKFETTIEYKIDEQVAARLVIRQADENFDGRVYLHSQIVILNP